ncbi:transmembrane protein [Achlya hypogyna]|uniref:Transmembrane protein n=1 Tax=Achlya hypogyna TaxID=1202772 RepID=A0A1V9YWR0_ACHHY|nr:transmembrane protein [Achlya hypogyna]
MKGMRSSTPSTKPRAKITPAISKSLHALFQPGYTPKKKESEAPSDSGKFRIALQDQAPKAKYVISPTFKFNLELGLRAGLGAVLASVFLTSYDGPQSGDPAYPKLYYFFPSWYILGGLSYVAIAMIFSIGTNVGSTIRETFQETLGVIIAFVYNLVVFSCFQPHVFASADEVAWSIGNGTLVQIHHAFSGTPYYVHQPDFHSILPSIIIFTIAIVMTPLETITKKLAVGNNVFFALTLINPNNCNNMAELKPYHDPMLSTINIFKNLFVYLLLGVLGGLIALVVMLLPYPILAIRRLQMETNSAPDTLAELLTLLVDAYCFRHKNDHHMKHLRQQLDRKFEAAYAKKAVMIALLDDVWWEQSLGLHLLLSYRTSIIKPFLDLYGALLDDLRAMHRAVQAEQFGRFHALLMSRVQNEIYLVQTHAVAAFTGIAREVHQLHRVLSSSIVANVSPAMQVLLRDCHRAHSDLCRSSDTSVRDIDDDMTCHLFLFALYSYCTTLVAFPTTFNDIKHNTSTRVWQFTQQWLRRMLDGSNYTKANLQTGVKVCCAIVCGSFFAVYVFGFSPTTASALAYLWGNHVGGSFRRTANRVGGAVAGSIVPSVLLFLICSYACDDSAVATALLDIVMCLWVTFSMYISLQNHSWSYAGFVSAYVSTGVFLRGCSCGSTAVAPVSSYANLAQVSLGIVFFILIELALFPQSATALMRANVQNQLLHLRSAFQILFAQTVSTKGDVPPAKVREMQRIVGQVIPALLGEQPGLLTEARYEPVLWKSPFPEAKYAAVARACERLHHHTMIMLKLALWFQKRKSSIKRRLTIQGDAFERRATRRLTSTATTTTPATTVVTEGADVAWTFSTKELGIAIDDTFQSLHTLFGAAFAFADADRVALFLQMKEAFRRADGDGDGELDAAEVAAILRRIFAASLAVEAVDASVKAFMAIVDTDRSGKVSCQEFMDAVERGLVLQVEEVHESRRSFRPRALLEINDVSLEDIAQTMRTSYATWLLGDRRFEKVSMDELLLLNCLMGCVTGIAAELQALADLTAQ